MAGLCDAARRPLGSRGALSAESWFARPDLGEFLQMLNDQDRDQRIRGV